MSANQVSLTIDGKPVTVPQGTTILDAAQSAGIPIPHYCYHPALEIAGSCRICQVEVKTVRGDKEFSSLTIACYTPVTEGSVVLTRSPLVRRVRRAVMEFLLLNHPIDCPICDTAGECNLQNYYMTEGLHRSRLRTPKKKRVKRKRIGAKVVLDQERCIHCTRCVRFLRDVTKTHELGMFDRGDNAHIDIVEGKTLDGNRYAGNVIDLCPVGALTDDDFRFKCRVWYLEQSPSICPHCANGCNIVVQFNADLCWKNDGMRIMRIKPRYNPHVNDYWMCDVGRYGYATAEAPSRLKQPLIRQGSGQENASWDEALDHAARELRRVLEAHGPQSLAVLPSLWLTTEAAWLTRRLFRDALGATIVLKRGSGPSGGDELLFVNDPNPNRLGLETVDCTGGDESHPRTDPLALIRDHGVKALVFFQDQPDRIPEPSVVDALAESSDLLIVFAANASALTERADVVLSTRPWSEDDGTWINWRGRVQRLTPALAPMGQARLTSRVLADLARRLDQDLGDGDPEATFAQLAEEIAAFGKMTYADLEGFGASLADYHGTRIPIPKQLEEGE
jgi:NADH-quinone oxidoreductase subunit G